MFWHIDSDIITLIIFTIIYVCNNRLPNPELDSDKDKRFRLCLAMGIWIAIIDIAASVVMEIPTNNFIYHVLMTTYFIFIEAVIVCWLLYVLTIIYPSDNKRRKIIERFSYALYVIYALICVSNPWTGIIYRLSPDGEYSRGYLFSIMLVIYSLYAMLVLILILFRWNKIPPEYPRWILLLTPIVIGSGIVIQLSIPGWLSIVPAYMISVLLAFLFLETTRAKYRQMLMEDLWGIAETDKLTGLYNRVGMEAKVQTTASEKEGVSVIVILVDIDDLKKINDTMGHHEGDRAIRQIGAQLKNHFRAGDTIVRYGGDEFLAFFTGQMEEDRIKASLQALVDELGQLRIGEQNDVPLHGSVGAAIGIVGKDSFESLCARADVALYYVKAHGKNGYAIYSKDME